MQLTDWLFVEVALQSLKTKSGFNPKPGGYGRKKTSKHVKIGRRIILIVKNKKTTCNPSLIVNS
jgi:hypothetical protein